MYTRMGDLANKVTAALNTGADTTPPETDNSQNDDKYTGTATVWYRVRKRWDDAQSQKGAFHDLKLAKECADSNPGYSVFDESGKAVYTSDSGSTSEPTTSLPYKAVPQTAGRKEKKFCSDRCRMKWWNSHLDQVQRKANYDFVCPVCKKPFTVYGNANRKYCSHECYIEDRFGGGR